MISYGFDAWLLGKLMKENHSFGGKNTEEDFYRISKGGGEWRMY